MSGCSSQVQPKVFEISFLGRSGSLLCVLAGSAGPPTISRLRRLRASIDNEAPVGYSDPGCGDHGASRCFPFCFQPCCIASLIDLIPPGVKDWVETYRTVGCWPVQAELA